MNKSIASYVRDRFWVLRRKKDNSPLNVSYTIDGLKWTSNKLGKALFFKDAYISKGKIVGEDLEMSDEVYVELFDPIEFHSIPLQRAELRFLDKALRMCY